MKALLDGFLDRRENVLAFGDPGSGPTQLSAPGQERIRRGRRVAFATCVRLVQDLLRAKGELRFSHQEARLYQALVIDNIGDVQQREVLFALLAECDERGSVLITSSLPFSKNGSRASKIRWRRPRPLIGWIITA